MRSFLALLLSLFACGAFAQPAAPACPPPVEAPSVEQLRQARESAGTDRGLLWRLSKDGHESYLYGTVHLGRPAWLLPGPRVQAALRASDTLALELDLGDAATRQQLAELSAARAPLDNKALRERLERHSAAACLPAQALSHLHPLMQAVTLTVLQARWDGLDPAYAIEQVLSAFARANQRRIVGLETPAQQLDLLLPRDEGEALMLTGRLLDQLEQGRVRPVLQRLSLAWEKGRLAELEDYEQWCDCVSSPADRAYLRRLNDERNPGLAARIDALHRGGARVFAAVGALHMTGPQSLPKLLGALGYRVERVAL